MARPARSLRFAIPPTLGAGRASRIAQELQGFFARTLGPALAVEVVVAESYPALGQYLLAGTADAGWAPPLVAARVEAHGGRAMVRCVRGGAATFRAALVCRNARHLTADRLSGLTAAWVDRDSASGYLLPQAWLRSRGVDPYVAFQRERFLGTFALAAAEVAAGRADVTATFASPQGATRAYHGLDELPAELRGQLKIFAFTQETSNDGVVAGPQLAEDDARALQRCLIEAHRTPEGRALLASALDAEQLTPAPPDGYRSVYNLVLQTLR